LISGNTAADYNIRFAWLFLRRRAPIFPANFIFDRFDLS
jgi:hypothetical protein